jgi:hypothetical protein
VGTVGQMTAAESNREESPGTLICSNLPQCKRLPREPKRLQRDHRRDVDDHYDEAGRLQQSHRERGRLPDTHPQLSCNLGYSGGGEVVVSGGGGGDGAVS